MINYKRVKRIKNAIYIFLLLLIWVPAILVLVLSVKMLRMMPELNRMVAEHRAVYVQVQGQSTPPGASGGQLPDSQSAEAAPLPALQGTSRAEDTPVSNAVQPESSAGENTPREQSHSANSPAPQGQPTEPLPEQGVTEPPSHGSFQSPNTGLSR